MGYTNVIAFGVMASAAFQGSNYVIENLSGQEEAPAEEAEAPAADGELAYSGNISSTQLPSLHQPM